MFNFPWFKTDAEKVAAAQYDKQKYTALKLENGRFGYKVSDCNQHRELNYQSSITFKTLNQLIAHLERCTAYKPEKYQTVQLKGEVIQ